MTHNGNIERVFEAISNGARSISDIEKYTGMSSAIVGNHVRRLCDNGRVIRLKTHPQTYEVKRTGCLLAEVWKGHLSDDYPVFKSSCASLPTIEYDQ